MVTMPTTTDSPSRTARLLALMKKGDDAFNARDFAAVDQVHHRDMIAYITGLAEPVYGKETHAAAMQQMLRMFPDMHVYSDPYPVQFGSGDWITVVTNATGTFTGEMALPATGSRELAGEHREKRARTAGGTAAGRLQVMSSPHRLPTPGLGMDQGIVRGDYEAARGLRRLP